MVNFVIWILLWNWDVLKYDRVWYGLNLFICLSILQILPTAQRLLDELLFSQQTAINTVCGAPGMSKLIRFFLKNKLYAKMHIGNNLTFLYRLGIHLEPSVNSSLPCYYKTNIWDMGLWNHLELTGNSS